MSAIQQLTVVTGLIVHDGGSLLLARRELFEELYLRADSLVCLHALPCPRKAGNSTLRLARAPFSGELELHNHSVCIWIPPSCTLALSLAAADAPSFRG